MTATIDEAQLQTEMLMYHTCSSLSQRNEMKLIIFLKRNGRHPMIESNRIELNCLIRQQQNYDEI